MQANAILYVTSKFYTERWCHWWGPQLLWKYWFWKYEFCNFQFSPIHFKTGFIFLLCANSLLCYSLIFSGHQLGKWINFSPYVIVFILSHSFDVSCFFILVDILYDSWSPAMTVSSVCISILSMLSSSTVKVCFWLSPSLQSL